MATLFTRVARDISTVVLFICLTASGGECEEPWHAEFDQVCAPTSEAMTLSITELASLIERCNRLQKTVDALEETVRKVYSKRLQLCRNLYVFAREAKQQEKLPGQQ